MHEHSICRRMRIPVLAIILGMLAAATAGWAAADPAPLTEKDCDCSPLDMSLEWARVESDASSSMLVWRCQSVSDGRVHWVDSRLYQFNAEGRATESFEQTRASFSQAIEWSYEGKEVSRPVTVVSEPDRFGSLRYYPAERLYWGEMALVRPPQYYAVFYLSYGGLDEKEARDIFETAARRILLIMDSKTLSGGITLPAPEEGAVRLGIASFTSGTVELQRPPSTAWVNLTPGFPLFSGDKIRTSKEGQAEILLGSSRIIGIGPETMIGLPAAAGGLPADPPLLNLARGRMWALIDPLSAEPFSTRVRTADLSVEVKDPAAAGFVGITRIEFLLQAEGGASSAGVLDGIVWISDAAGAASAAVDAGKTVRVESGAALSAPEALELDAADRWWAGLPHATAAESPAPTADPPEEPSLTLTAPTPSPTTAETPAPAASDADSDDLPIAVVIVPIVVGVMLALVGLFFYRRGIREAQAPRKPRRD